MTSRIVLPALIRRLTLGSAGIALLFFGSIWAVARAQTTPTQIYTVPGSQADGSVLLSNGWKVAPTGKSLPVGPMPLNVVLSPDNKYAIVTNNGIAKPSFTIVDLAKWTIKGTV